MTLLDGTQSDLFGDTLKSDLMTFQIWIPEKILESNDDHKAFQDLIKSKRAQIRKEMTSSRIELVLPKMKLDFDQDIVDSLKELGLEKIFQSGQHFDPLFGAGNYPNTFIRTDSKTAIILKNLQFLVH